MSLRNIELPLWLSCASLPTFGDFFTSCYFIVSGAGYGFLTVKNPWTLKDPVAPAVALHDQERLLVNLRNRQVGEKEYHDVGTLTLVVIRLKNLIHLISITVLLPREITNAL